MTGDVTGDAADDVSYDQQVLDVNGKVVVMHTNRKSLPNISYMAEQMRTAGAELVIIITDDTSVETLDEEQMRQAGWVRG